MEALADDSDKLSGTLHLDVAAQEIREIDIHTTGTLSPAFSVTLQQYRLKMRFRQMHGNNLLQEMLSHFAGKAGFLKRFDKQVQINFSDYRAAPPPR